MASYQDLLDAIARVRAATGRRDAWQSGLSGDDIATACSVLSAPSALGAVLMKIIAAHPESFLEAGRPNAPAPPVGEGLAADAIRDAQTALAQQNSMAARVDLQVVTAVLNAHAANVDGANELERLQREIESTVLADTDLNTPAGAREFQRFLLGKLRDIRTVVDTAGLDDTSKAALAAALASLYASATPQPDDRGGSEPETAPPQQRSPKPEPEAPRPTVASEPAVDSGLPWEPLDLAPYGFGDVPSDPAPLPLQPLPPAPVAPAPMPAPMPAPPMSAPAMVPSTPAWGGGVPAAMGGGLPAGALADLARPDPLAHRTVDNLDEPLHAGDADPADSAPEDSSGDSSGDASGADPKESPATDEPTVVHLPDGETVSAPTPEIAAAMTAALGGTPIPDAFGRQGITLPAPGSAVIAGVDPARLLPGDIGVLNDRHALALGNAKALLDGKIQPIANVAGPGFLGWLHPPVAGSAASPQASTPSTPEVPASDRPPAATAPS